MFFFPFLENSARACELGPITKPSICYIKKKIRPLRQKEIKIKSKKRADIPIVKLLLGLKEDKTKRPSPYLCLS